MIDLLDRRLPQRLLDFVVAHLPQLVLRKVHLEPAHRPALQTLGVPLAIGSLILAHEFAERGGDIRIGFGARLVLDVLFQFIDFAFPWRSSGSIATSKLTRAHSATVAAMKSCVMYLSTASFIASPIMSQMIPSILCPRRTFCLMP